VKASTTSSTPVATRPLDDQIWYDLYVWLLPLVEKWVRYANVVAWYGQQKEVSEDITQEAVLRTFHYNQRADHGEVRPIDSLKSLCKTIAQNYFRDRRKKDWNLVRPSQENSGPEESYPHLESLEDPSQIAVDHLLLKNVITIAARLVVRFPPGQRAALLTDLALISDFGEQPTLLEQVLSEEGIHLRDYRQPLPDDPGAKNRHAALLSIAYKRLRKEVSL
jgi:hypothetical protein